METREEMETQTRTDPRGQEETEGPGVGKLMDGLSGALSTTDSAERCLAVAPRDRKPPLTQ